MAVRIKSPYPEVTGSAAHVFVCVLAVEVSAILSRHLSSQARANVERDLLRALSAPERLDLFEKEIDREDYEQISKDFQNQLASPELDALNLEGK